MPSSTKHLNHFYPLFGNFGLDLLARLGPYTIIGHGPYGPGSLEPYGPGPFIILKNILWKSNMLQDHNMKSMLLEQCTLQIWYWSTFDLENSFRV